VAAAEATARIHTSAKSSEASVAAAGLGRAAYVAGPPNASDTCNASAAAVRATPPAFHSATVHSRAPTLHHAAVGAATLFADP
jgi:hypothetical protein